MSDIQRKFDSNIASGPLTSIGAGEQFFTITPNMSQHEGCMVQIDADFVSSPTDNMLVNVYARQDDTNYDITPFMTFVLDKDTDPNRVTFVVEKVFEFRVGVQRDGSTDAHTSAQMDSRLWKWEVV